jgi:hypothetical protein
MLTVTWVKSIQNTWLRLDESNNDLTEDHPIGVYVVWHGGQTPRTVRVGKGDIRKLLASHRADPDIRAYTSYDPLYGPLYVTWAPVSPANLDAVERFLADKLHPLVGECPEVSPLSVNLPWAA